MKKFLWFLKKLWGRKYFVVKTNKLLKDEILIIGHRIYIEK